MIDEPNVEALTRERAARSSSRSTAGRRDARSGARRASSSARTTTSTTSRSADSRRSFRSALAARLRRSHFLFLGYALDDWSLRVFLRRLWGERAVGYRSWAVGRARAHRSSGVLAAAGVDLYECRSRTTSTEPPAASRVATPRRDDGVGRRRRRPSPYKGLAPFEDSELDALLFFGREREREIIAANLVRHG